jgi:hypothetical protein
MDCLVSVTEALDKTKFFFDNLILDIKIIIKLSWTGHSERLSSLWVKFENRQI